MNKTIITITIIAVVLVGGYFLIFRGTYQPAPSVSQRSGHQPTSPEPPASKPSTQTQPVRRPESQAATVQENVVVYTNGGYSPATLKIKRGESVIFRNQSLRAMWTASDVHPTHRIYSGSSLSEHCGSGAEDTSFDACKGVGPGGSWSFTFDEIGSWGYHNHLNPSDTGTIVVE